MECEILHSVVLNSRSSCQSVEWFSCKWATERSTCRTPNCCPTLWRVAPSTEPKWRLISTVLPEPVDIDGHLLSRSNDRETRMKWDLGWCCCTRIRIRIRIRIGRRRVVGNSRRFNVLSFFCGNSRVEFGWIVDDQHPSRHHNHRQRTLSVKNSFPSERIGNQATARYANNCPHLGTGKDEGRYAAPFTCRRPFGHQRLNGRNNHTLNDRHHSSTIDCSSSVDFKSAATCWIENRSKIEINLPELILIEFFQRWNIRLQFLLKLANKEWRDRPWFERQQSCIWCRIVQLSCHRLVEWRCNPKRKRQKRETASSHPSWTLHPFWSVRKIEKINKSQHYSLSIFYHCILDCNRLDNISLLKTSQHKLMLFC